MCEHAAFAKRPVVAYAQRGSFVPFRASPLWVARLQQASQGRLLNPRRHYHQTTTACHCDSHLDSHVCRRSVLALGVAGVCMTQRAQTANAETALPPELREHCISLRASSFDTAARQMKHGNALTAHVCSTPLQAKPYKGLCSS